MNFVQKFAGFRRFREQVPLGSNVHAGYSMKVPGSRRFMSHVQDFAGIKRFREQFSILGVQEIQWPASERFPGTEEIRVLRVLEVPGSIGSRARLFSC
jgi:hypothetical protein